MDATTRYFVRAAVLRPRPFIDLIRIAGGSLVFWYAMTGHLVGHAHAQAPAASSAPGVHIVARTEPAATLGKPTALNAATVLKLAEKPPSADDKIKALGYEPANVRAAIAAYRSGHFDAGDALAGTVKDASVRTSLEWVALRNMAPTAGLARLEAFATAHPDWVAGDWLRREVEGRLLRAHDPAKVLLFFSTQAPDTAAGKLALARALKATGREADGTKLARAVFREHDMQAYLESWFLAEFGNDLTRGDYKYRADRRLYKGYVAAALRDAARAGPDVVALTRARAALLAKRADGTLFETAPEAWRAEPGLILAEVHRLRHAGKLITAAQLLRTVTSEQARIVDGDEWWTERRLLARELLDAGKPNAAYITCALHAHGSRASDVEAEFHAGWIALRFMHEPERAAYHFWAASKVAQTPLAVSRAAYWQGRAADASADPTKKAQAKEFYGRAADHAFTYYGQLARQALGRPIEVARAPTIAAVGRARSEATQAIELLYAAGEKDSAAALAVASANRLDDARQIAAVESVISAQEDAHLSLIVGKLFAQRGIPLDALAFPTFGVPAYKELANSAGLPVVYSVARQESAFITRAVSSAHANGLMQMIDATAWATARKAGLPFSHARLLHDASYNAQLGAAHLGTLISEHGGSLVLTFAAYNAGGGRVHQWIEEYGDPRKPGVDQVDWVERIPYSETRDYVQRVMENLGMYNALFAEKARGGMLARRGGGEAGL